MKNGTYIKTVYSEEDIQPVVDELESAMIRNKLPGRIVTERRRVHFKPQWDIYHVID